MLCYLFETGSAAGLSSGEKFLFFFKNNNFPYFVENITRLVNGWQQSRIDELMSRAVKSENQTS